MKQCGGRRGCTPFGLTSNVSTIAWRRCNFINYDGSSVSYKALILIHCLVTTSIPDCLYFGYGTSGVKTPSFQSDLCTDAKEGVKS